MSDDLDTKSGKVFEAESKYLYQKKIEELEKQLAIAVEALAACDFHAVSEGYDDNEASRALEKIRGDR